MTGQETFALFETALRTADEAASTILRECHFFYGFRTFVALNADVLLQTASFFADIACYSALVKALQPAKTE